jgi:hypothetical protein
VEARSFLLPEQVKNWFLLWKQLLEFPEDRFKIERDSSAVYIMGDALLIPELDLSDFDEARLIIGIGLAKTDGGLQAAEVGRAALAGLGAVGR